MRKLGLLFLSVLVISCGSKNTKTAVVTPSKVKLNKEVVATPSTTIKVEVLETEVLAASEGKNLYESSCAKCHQLFPAKDFSKTAWKPILVNMQKKAHLSNDEMEKISKYIYSEF
jgi:mono/diheme cytochrome c family protein